MSFLCIEINTINRSALDVPKKIAFIAHWYPNEVDHHKGIFIENHAKCLATISDLTVIAFDIRTSKLWFKFSQSFEDQENHKLLRITLESRFYKFFYYFLFFQYWCLRRALKKCGLKGSDFDLVVTNVLFPSGIIGWKLAKSWGLKLIHIEHWSYFDTFLRKDIHRFKARRMLRYADKVLVVSDVLKQLVKNHFPEDKIHILPNIVDPPFGFKEKEPTEVYRFLAISNWQKPKNPFPYLEALEQLAKDHKLKLTMVGKGPILEEVKKRKWSFEIEFPGTVKHDELGSFYHQADFFLHGSDFETFSIVGVEALMTGTPVIANRVGVLPEIINKDNGLIIEENDWLEAIDRALRSEYQHAAMAKEIAGKFSKAKITRSINELIN